MAEQEFEKTEQPTAKRLEEARERGNVPRSTDLSAALAMLAAVLLLQFFGLDLLTGLRQTVTVMLDAGLAANPTQSGDVRGMLLYGLYMAAVAAAPVAVCLALVGVLANVGQVGLMITTHPLTPDFAKLSPMRGFQNLVNARAGVRLVMSLSKIAIIAAVATVFIVQDLPRIVTLAEMELLPLFAASCELVYLLALKLAILLLVLAVTDYAFQRWQHRRELMMSKQEVKEELKRMDGDPLIKQRRARVARQLAMARMGQAVPRADVVVTNPTHFAVALKYDGATMRAPKVVAKGADFMAMRIRQLAALHGVPIVERKELARALYKDVDIGMEVPPTFYGAVAEILAYVYRMSGRRTA